MVWYTCALCSTPVQYSLYKRVLTELRKKDDNGTSKLGYTSEMHEFIAEREREGEGARGFLTNRP